MIIRKGKRRTGAGSTDDIKETGAGSTDVTKENKILKFIYYLKEAMDNSYIDRIAIKVRSKKDMDILVEVNNTEKIVPVLMMIEANLYTRPLLNVSKVNRFNNTLALLTKSDETIKIFIYNTNDFEEITQGKLR